METVVFLTRRVNDSICSISPARSGATWIYSIATQLEFAGVDVIIRRIALYAQR